MAVQDAPARSRRAADTRCPTCGAPAERGQLVCLECGSRIALTYRGPPSWRLPIAIMTAVVVLAVASAIVAYEAIADDAKSELAATPVHPKEPPAGSPKPAKAKPETASPGAPAGIVRRGALYTWPRSLEGFTVVVLSSEDRVSATAFARSVANAHAAKAGVIGSDDFKTLPKGFFVVFAGQYPSRSRADKAAARLGRRYKGAFTQRVSR